MERHGECEPAKWGRSLQQSHTVAVDALDRFHCWSGRARGTQCVCARVPSGAARGEVRVLLPETVDCVYKACGREFASSPKLNDPGCASKLGPAAPAATASWKRLPNQWPAEPSSWWSEWQCTPCWPSGQWWERHELSRWCGTSCGRGLWRYCQQTTGQHKRPGFTERD